MEKEKGLRHIRGNRRLVEELYSHGEITEEARDYALSLLYPHKQWGLWISHFLLVLGTALVLSGIVYFFAFNWSKITPSIKLTSIQIGIMGSIIGAYYYSLQRIGGQLLLLSASVLIGVFMAVFGQIYQTGADAYQLFMTWSLFVFGWTVISKFSAQWVLYLVITNIFIILWWEQSALPSDSMSSIIHTYLILFNGLALALHEYFAKKRSYEWLNARWLRILLSITVLIMMATPICLLITDLKITMSIIISSTAGLIGHGLIYIFYRYKRPDMLVLASLVLSVCIIIETIIIKIIDEVYDWKSISFLFAGIITLCVFTCAVIFLRKVSKQMEVINE